MVSFNVYRSTTSGFYVEGVCLITDEKPVVGIANGSILFAVDTSSGETTRFMYDQSTMSWVEAACPCAGGGSGSGGDTGSGGPLIVEVNDSTGEADKTFREIVEALTSGRGAIVDLVNSRPIPPSVISARWNPVVFATTSSAAAPSICTYITVDENDEVKAISSKNTGAGPDDYPNFNADSTPIG